MDLAAGQPVVLPRGCRSAGVQGGPSIREPPADVIRTVVLKIKALHDSRLGIKFV